MDVLYMCKFEDRKLWNMVSVTAVLVMGLLILLLSNSERVFILKSNKDGPFF